MLLLYCSIILSLFFINKPGTCWKDLSLHTIIIIISNQKWSIYNFIKERISYLQYNPAFLRSKWRKWIHKDLHTIIVILSLTVRYFLGYHEQRYILMINMAHLWIHILLQIFESMTTSTRHIIKNVRTYWVIQLISIIQSIDWMNDFFIRSSFFFKDINWIISVPC